VKLEALKASLREWSKQGISSPEDRINIIRKTLKQVQDDLASQPLSMELQKHEVQLQSELSVWLGLEEYRLRQKSR